MDDEFDYDLSLEDEITELGFDDTEAVHTEDDAADAELDLCAILERGHY